MTFRRIRARYGTVQVVLVIMLSLLRQNGSLAVASTEHQLDDATNHLSLVRSYKLKGSANAVAWTPRGNHFVTLSDFGSQVSIFETSSSEPLYQYQRYSGGYSQNSVAVLQDDNILASAPRGKPNGKTP